MFKTKLTARFLGILLTNLFVLMCVLMGAIIYVLNESADYEIKRAKEQNLELVTSLINAYNDSISRSSKDLNKLLAQILAGKDHRKFNLQDKEILFNGSMIKDLRIGDVSLANNTALLDVFKNITGASATVFLKRGSQFLRIATTLKKANGKRAIGTVLNPAHPSYKRLLNKHTYTGFATLFGKNYYTSYRPILVNGNFLGVLYIGVPFNELFDIMKGHLKKLHIGDSGFVSGYYLGSNDFDFGPYKGSFNPKALFKENESDASFSFKGEKIKALKFAYKPWNYAFVINVKESDYLKAVRQSEYIFAFACVFIVLLMGVLTSLLVSSLIGSPLKALRIGLDEFFKYVRHESKEIPKMIRVYKDDELGQMAAQVNDNINKRLEALSMDTSTLNDAINTLRAIEAGDFTTRISKTPANLSLLQLKTVLNDMLNILEQNIGSNLNEIREVFKSFKRADFTARVLKASGFIALSTNDLGEQIVSMLKRSEGFASELLAQSSTLEEEVNALNTASKEGASELESSANSLECLSSSMQDVEGKSSHVKSQADEIRNFTAIIGDIADQINLLALNAAIEAARAGEHGKGFAVVADEVRSLAERTQKSLSEIEASTNLLNQGINDMASGVSEQSEGIARINDAIASLEKVANDNLITARKSALVSTKVASIAGEILSDVRKNKY